MSERPGPAPSWWRWIFLTAAAIAVGIACYLRSAGVGDAAELFYVGVLCFVVAHFG